MTGLLPTDESDRTFMRFQYNTYGFFANRVFRMKIGVVGFGSQNRETPDSIGRVGKHVLDVTMIVAPNQVNFLKQGIGRMLLPY